MPVSTRRTFKQCQTAFHDEIHRLAALAWGHYMRTGGLYPVYLVGKKGHPAATDIWTAFDVHQDSDGNDGDWIIVTPENLPRNATLDQMRDKIHAILKNEPNWLFAD